MSRLVVLHFLAFGLIFSASLFGQAEWPRPDWEHADTLSCRFSDKTAAVPLGKYQIRLVRVSGRTENVECRSFLLDPAGRKTVLLKDWEVAIHQGTGDDLFGDGTPSLVLRATPGAHIVAIHTRLRIWARFP